MPCQITTLQLEAHGPYWHRLLSMADIGKSVQFGTQPNNDEWGWSSLWDWPLWRRRWEGTPQIPGCTGPRWHGPPQTRQSQPQGPQQQSDSQTTATAEGQCQYHLQRPRVKGVMISDLSSTLHINSDWGPQFQSCHWKCQFQSSENYRRTHILCWSALRAPWSKVVHYNRKRVPFET